MPFIVAAPEMMASAESDLAGIASMISEADAAAAPTTEVVPATGDEVSIAIASLFSSHAQAYQSLSARAATFHQQLLQALNRARISYAAAEATNASLVQTVQNDALSAVNAPTELLLGRPLIGNGTNGAPTTSSTAAAATVALAGPVAPVAPATAARAAITLALPAVRAALAVKAV